MANTIQIAGDERELLSTRATTKAQQQLQETRAGEARTYSEQWLVHAGDPLHCVLTSAAPAEERGEAQRDQAERRVLRSGAFEAKTHSALLIKYSRRHSSHSFLY